MSESHGLTRRTFVSSGIPLIVPASALGLGGATPPSDRITMACIGLGPRGRYDLDQFMQHSDLHFVAVADCFADRRADGKAAVDAKYGNKDCAAYRFHEQVLERKDVDAVLIATGDRWHSVMSVLAAQAGKDIYCEKPISLTIAEGRALVNALQRYGVIWQCGMQRKSIPAYKFVVDAVQKGRIGNLHTITLSIGDGPWRRNIPATPQPTPDPEVFDYDRWLGQVPWAPYSADRVRHWRLNWDTSGGPLADMGPHYADFAQWARGGQVPIEFEGEGAFRPEHQFNNIPYFVDVRARYADDVRMIIDSKPKSVRFDGDEGWIQLLDDGALAADPASLLKGTDGLEGTYKVMGPHIRNFVESVRARKQPVSPPENAQRAHTTVHCANLCLRLGRKLRWDPESELFIGDDEANNLLARQMRAPWVI